MNIDIVHTLENVGSPPRQSGKMCLYDLANLEGAFTILATAT